jgi:hypothetical protein
MNVRHLIEHLQQFDPELPVRLEIYGCGTTQYEDIDQDAFTEQKPKFKKDPPPFLKINAVYN